MLTIWATWGGVAVSSGPIFAATEATVVMTELGRASKSRVVLPAADARAVAALAPYTLLEIVQDGVGTIGMGYVLDPVQQVSDRDEHTIALDLEPLTVECTWWTTGPEWVAANWLTVVATRLATLTPGWSCDPSTVGAGAGGDFQVSATLDDATALDGFLSVAKQFGQYARQGVDATGAPARVLETGQFGAAPAATLVSADGGDPDAIAANGTVALAATVEWRPGDASALVNVVAPRGGGNSPDALVDLERLWRILYDPQYPNYGRYGADAESVARTGKASVFTEYDPLYPIADPTTGTRGFTTQGRYLYPVYDAASYAQYGHRGGRFVDAALTYADSSVANQETTARALYVEAVANFKRFGHPHRAFTCTVAGAAGRPTRAGDLIAVDYSRVSVGEGGAVVEIAVQETLRVMRVERQFRGDAPPVDTYTLSNLGRYDEDDAQGGADTGRQLVALQVNRGTGLAPMTIGPFADNADAAHALDIPVRIPAELFRWHKCSLRVDFFPYRATAVTAQNSDATITVTGIDHGTHTVQHTSGGAIPSGGVATSRDQIGGMPTHVHQIAETGTPLNRAPTGSDNWLYGYTDGSGQTQIVSSKGQTGQFQTGSQITNINLAPTAASHTVPIAPTVAPSKTTLSGPLPVHTHPLDQRIPDGPSPVNVTLTINGQNLTSGATLTSGTRNGDGTFSNSFEVDDISAFVQLPGQTVTITLHPGTGGGNPYGVGRFMVSGTWFGEFGGLTSTIVAQ